MANSTDPDQLLLQKPTDLGLHCLKRQGISGFSRTRVKIQIANNVDCDQCMDAHADLCLC